MIQSSDIDGIALSGVEARRVGADYFDNPFLRGGKNDWMNAQVEVWMATCTAWWSGWLREDAGRTERIHRLLRIPSW